MSKDIVDNRKSDFVYVVYRSERYHSSWVGQGGCYPKVYIYIYKKKRSYYRASGKERGDHANIRRGTGSGWNSSRSLPYTYHYILTSRQLLR